MRLAAVLMLVSLGCASSPQIPPTSPMYSPRWAHLGPCVIPRASISERLAIMTGAAIVIGGVVAAGYFAIGGEAPLR